MVICTGELARRSNAVGSSPIATARPAKETFVGCGLFRINAAARMHGLTYSKFMSGLKLANVDLDRRVLASVAMHEPEAFAEVAALAKKHLS